MGKREEEAVLRVLRSGWLTTGPETAAFEKEFASFTGAPHALAVNSATAGLHLALEAMGLREGEAVIVPSFTFTATAEVVRYCGGEPVFADVAEGSFNMDPRDCERQIRLLKKKGQHVKCIIPVHLGGDPEFLEDHLSLSRELGTYLLEDGAHCFPVDHERGMIGTWSDGAVYSFYANKTITTGEGGMIILDKPEWAKRIKMMRLHGINRGVWDRFTQPRASWEYDVEAPGYKYNMTDMAAAIGRVQLTRAREFLDKRKALVKAYISKLEDADFLSLPPWKETHAWHLFIIRLNLEKLNISRNGFIKELGARGIGTSVHYKPLHMMSYYKKHCGLKREDLPRTAELFDRIISLPLYPDLKEEQLERIVREVMAIGKKYRRGRFF